MSIGESIIIPSDMRTDAITISITKKGKNNRKPIWKAVLSSEVINEGIKIKILNHDGANLELNKVIEKASFNHLYKLLDDTNNAISLSQTTVNMKLLLDNVLVVWSHITNLKKYPAITNFQEQ